MTEPKNKIILIEPSPVIQYGLKILIEQSNEFEIVESYSDLKAFEENTDKAAFQIVLINPALVNIYKPVVVKNIFSAYSNIIVIGVVYTYINAETLSALDGVLDIYDDSLKMTKKLQKIVEATLQKKNNTNPEGVELSDREKEILIAVAKGLTNKEIAEKHFISIHTVISHRKNISRKTGIKTVSGLTIYAIFNNLIAEEDL